MKRQWAIERQIPVVERKLEAARTYVAKLEKELDGLRSDLKNSHPANVSPPSERVRSAFEMRQSGMTFKAIGEKLGVGSARARDMCKKTERWDKFSLAKTQDVVSNTE